MNWKKQLKKLIEMDIAQKFRIHPPAGSGRGSRPYHGL